MSLATALDIGLSGTGLLYQTYFVGVLEVLTAQGIISPGVTRLAGSSGGAITAVIYNSGE